MPDQLLTQADVCRVLGISRTTLWKWRREGRLPAIYLGSLLRFKGDHVAQLIERSTTVGRPINGARLGEGDDP